VTAASVIVVGGGILGATTFWELARAEIDVLLLEAGRFAGGSTSKSAGIVRCHYSNPEVVRMALRSRETLRRLPLLLDCPPVYRRTGWLFLVDEADAPAAVANAEMQDEEGLEAIDVDDLQEIVPGIDERGVAYALYEPESGFADPVATTAAYIEAGRRQGGIARERTRVDSIEVERGRVRGARVGGELLECEALVLAAGPWSGKLAAGAGVELPLEITREQDVVFETAPEPPVPCAVSSQVDRIYLRPVPEQGQERLLVGRGYPKEYEQVDPDDYDEDVDPAFEQDVRERAAARVPRLAGMRRIGGRVGLYDVTPDWHPLLGPVAGVEGLHLATGGSGHCFKLGPAIGELVAAELLGRTLEHAEIERFSHTRFASGRELRSTYGGNRA
jgi:glycine/D-amino acid oxidase-like deaminating enzyme